MHKRKYHHTWGGRYCTEEFKHFPHHWEMFSPAVDDAFYMEVCMGLNAFDDIFGGAGKKGATCALFDEDFQKQYPILFILMTSTEPEAGKPRQVCTMTIVCEDGVVKAGLRERDRALSLWTSCASLGGVFAALEEACNEKPSRWRRLDAKWKK